VGAESDPLYAMSSPTAEDTLAQSRVAIVNRALEELQASNRGEVGYAGTVAPWGIRYDQKLDNFFQPRDFARGWCTDFVTWLLRPHLQPKNFWVRFGHAWNIGLYFPHFRSWFSANRMKPEDFERARELAAPGDPVTTDDDGEESVPGTRSIDHSAIFLALDDAGTPDFRDDDTVVTLDGNIANEVRIQRRNRYFTKNGRKYPIIVAFARLTPELLK